LFRKRRAWGTIDWSINSIYDFVSIALGLLNECHELGCWFMVHLI
jgi:hypothetical protein